MTSSGSFGRITFRAKAVGNASISVAGDSKLINDGEEVGNPGGFNSIAVKIIPSTANPAEGLQLTSPTHPDSGKWYQSNIVSFKWAETGSNRYLWEFDQSPDTIPSKSISEQTKQIKGVKNGVWYFHLSADPAAESNGPVVAHYKVQVDNLKPNPIEPYLDIGNKSELSLRFATTDYHSGIGSYDLQVNQTNFDNVASPYALHGLNVGSNFINVTAYDLAGNSRIGWIKFVLNSDGTIHDIVTSGSGSSICGLVPVLCTANGLIGILVLLLIILILVIIFRRKVNVLDTKTITKTDFGTVAKIVTKTDPKTGKKLITKTVTKTDLKNIVETDIGTVTKEELDQSHNDEHDKK
jgi:hypothetical protein